MQAMSWVWLGALILFGVVEAVTAGLVSIWFAAGALAALGTALVGLSTTVQVVVFVLVSALTLALTRPLVRKYQSGKVTPTNADRLLGETARVTDPIRNETSSGAVYADGKTWTARSTGGTEIPAGTTVRIDRLEGVKLYVSPLATGKESAT